MEDIVKCFHELCHIMAPIPTGVEAKLCPIPNVRAVLFDVYGTLFISGSDDTSADHGERNSAALADAMTAVGLHGDMAVAGHLGVAILDELIAQQHQRLHDDGVQFSEVDIVAVWMDVVADLAGRRVLSGVGGGEAIRHLAVQYECRVNPAWPMPGVGKMLSQLRRSATPLGIVANAQFFTPLLFDAFLGGTPEELSFIPECIAWSFRRGIAKPCRQLFVPVLENLEKFMGITPRQVMYVGSDMLDDIQPAASLGCRTALFAGDRRSLRLREDYEKCQAVEPDLVLTALEQLVPAIRPE